MSKREIKAGSTDQTIDVFIQDSSSTTGQGLAGLVYNSASLACYYRKGATGSATQLSLATQTVGGAHSDGGFVEIQATNMKGVYRLDLSDTMVASAGMLTIMLYGATNMAPVVAEIEVVSVDKFDAVRGGMTALPNANAGAAGGLPTDSTGKTSFNDLSQANVRSAVGLASANLDTQLSAIDDYVDTELASILAAVDTEVAAIKVVTDAIGATAAANLAKTLSNAGVVSFTAQTGTLSTTQASTNLSEATNDHYIGRSIVWLTGALAGQATTITDYVGVNGVLTFVALTEAPANGDTGVIV